MAQAALKEKPVDRYKAVEDAYRSTTKSTRCKR